MPNLKDLKNRIGSVKSTQKITKAMQMVAASKLRRAQERAESARPYAEKMTDVLVDLARSVDPSNAPELLTGRCNEQGKPQVKTHLLVAITSDRGLCGGYNGSLAKEVKRQAETLESKGQQVKLLLLGKKGFEQLKSTYADQVLARHDFAGQAQPEYRMAEEMARQIQVWFADQVIDACTLIYSRFINPLTQEVTPRALIPMELPELKEEDAVKAKEKEARTYAYEPEEEAVLKDLLPQNLAIQIFRGLLENAASEQGARMTAMDNATRNAGEMIGKLTLQYNRTRQAAITTELTEIVAGAEAV